MTGPREGLASSHAAPLSVETSIRIGGQAREYYAPASLEELCCLLSVLRDRRPFILGGGCNTLFPDEPFQRPVISTSKLRGIEVVRETLLVECGVSIGALIGRSIQEGLGGLECFVGIPGTVGGAVVMNAGGSGATFGQRVRELGLVSREGEVVMLPGEEVPWDYRSWNLKGYVVAWAALEAERDSPGRLKARARELLHRKRRSQPLGEASAGCVFKNPPGRPAGALIDALGLKGLRCGGAVVSERHANFIVNRGRRARADDVLRLIDEVRKRVDAAYDIQLETEIVLAGDDGG